MKRLTAQTRAELKLPLGRIADSSGAARAANLVGARGGLVISVGDFCTLELLRCGVKPDVVIYDHLCKRKPDDKGMRGVLDAYDGKGVKVRNPAGTICDGLERAIEAALAKGHGKILVEGEEDLAALPAIMLAPECSLIVYGQPDEGAVLVEATEEKKTKAREIYSRMETA